MRSTLRFLAALVVASALALPASAAAPTPPKAPAPAQSSDKAALDQLFARLGKASSNDEAKPIEKEIILRFLQSGSASVDLLMGRVDALMQTGDKDDAGKILVAVTRIAPTYAEGWHERGKLEALTGKDEAALVSLNKAVTLNPRNFAAYVDLGDMEEQYGAKPAALSLFKKALALDPQFDGLDKKVEELARSVEGEKI